MGIVELVCLVVGAGLIGSGLNSIASELKRANVFLENLAMTNRDMHNDSAAMRESLRELERRDGYEDTTKLFKKLDDVINELDDIKDNTRNK